MKTKDVDLIGSKPWYRAGPDEEEALRPCTVVLSKRVPAMRCAFAEASESSVCYVCDVRRFHPKERWSRHFLQVHQ